ncbi:MAG: hypothetical protein LBH21_03105 [Gracilibacteraceae bacterium]|jgi:uncharacterized membrane protein YgcG|nr:hypothetical protein [Gracilibacteraceae bacterium]
MRDLAAFFLSDGILSVMAIVAFTAFTIALITVLLMKAAMNEARRQNLAHNYVKQGSFVLRESKDIYLYQNTTKTLRQRQDSGGRPGGGGRPASRPGGARPGGGRPPASPPRRGKSGRR